MITIENNEIQILLIDSLIEDGLHGFWEETYDGKIIIGNNESPAIYLDEFIIKNGYFDYQTAIKFMLNLGNQISTLIDNNYGILFFSLHDIIVVNNTFLITNLSKIVSLNKNNLLILTEPIQFDGFLAPEIEKEKNNNISLPFKINHNVSYYSAALLCLYCLDIDKNMYSIYNTKLYYLLHRCMEHNYENRIFLYI